MRYSIITMSSRPSAFGVIVVLDVRTSLRVSTGPQATSKTSIRSAAARNMTHRGSPRPRRFRPRAVVYGMLDSLSNKLPSDHAFGWRGRHGDLPLFTHGPAKDQPEHPRFATHGQRSGARTRATPARRARRR